MIRISDQRQVRDRLEIVLRVALLAAALCGSGLGHARADDFASFESARELYEKGQYDKARERFELLLEGDVSSRLTSDALVLESRKYLGLCYLFLQRAAEAEQQFILLLEAEPNYQLDPVAHPKVAYTAFDQARRRLQRRLQAERRADEQQKGKKRQQADRTAMLLQLAQTETVEQRHSRGVAAIPFGVGQFQNGDRALGIAMATLQSTFLATSVATFLLHSSLYDANPAQSELDQARRTERALRATNWVSLSLFAVLAIAGVIDAQLRFKPSERRTRKRRLPDELTPPKAVLAPAASAEP